MKIKNNKLVITVCTLIALVMLTINVYGAMLTVTTDTLKLRKEPSTDSNVLDLLSYNEKYEIIEKTGDWYKIKYKDYSGYVHKDYVKEDTKDENPATSSEQKQPDNQTTSNNEEKENPENSSDIIIAGEMKLQDKTEIKITPIMHASTFTTLEKNTTVKIITVLNGWVYIQADKINGWVRKEKLTKETVDEPLNNQEQEQKPEEIYQEKTMYVNESSVNVRSQSNTNSSIVHQIILNKEVRVVGEENDWYKVKVDGKDGYILKKLLSDKKTTTSRGSNTRKQQSTNSVTNTSTTNVSQTTKQEVIVESTSSNSKTDDIVAYAKKFLGCRYVYGGSGPNTFDCSGFTMYVYKNFGVSLSHSATAQSKQGTRIERANIRPGDLVTFNDNANTSIGHIGLYIGGGQFIHAASGKGKVVISSLSESYYAKRLVAITRVI